MPPPCLSEIGEYISPRSLFVMGARLLRVAMLERIRKSSRLIPMILQLVWGRRLTRKFNSYSVQFEILTIEWEL